MAKNLEEFRAGFSALFPTITRPSLQPITVVVFKDDKLDSMDTGGPLPAEREFIGSIATYRISGEGPSLALTEEQIKTLPVPAKPPPPEPVPPAPQRSYPPLEPRP